MGSNIDKYPLLPTYLDERIVPTDLLASHNMSRLSFLIHIFIIYFLIAVNCT